MGFSTSNNIISLKSSIFLFTLDNFILVEFEITAAPGGWMFKISKWIILNF